MTYLDIPKHIRCARLLDEPHPFGASPFPKPLGIPLEVSCKLGIFDLADNPVSKRAVMKVKLLRVLLILNGEGSFGELRRVASSNIVTTGTKQIIHTP